MIYAGIGARDTPKVVIGLIYLYAAAKAVDGATLRSGGAKGADSAFEDGALSRLGKTEIYTVHDVTGQHKEAYRIAEECHPNWDHLTDYVRKLMVRNVFIIGGKDTKTPAKYVLCWKGNRPPRILDGRQFPLNNEGAMKLKNSNTVESCLVEWKPIPGYEGFYSVTEDGRVMREERQAWNGRVFHVLKRRKLRPTLGSNGYRTVTLCREGERTLHRVHQLVAAAFIGPRPDGMDTDHIDRNPDNNHVSNLRYVTHRVNMYNNNAKGYSWDKRSGRWQAYIGTGAGRRHLGYFDVEAEARSAYLAAKEHLLAELDKGV